MENEDALKIPPTEENGFIPTLNNMGYMTSALDETSKKFVEFASKQKLPSLDIGAAYGIASRQVIENGGTILINDLDARHLELFEQTLSPELAKRIKKKPGNFLDLDLPENSVSSILACRVLHFFRGETIEKASKILYKWIRTEGRIFIVCETPYLRNFQNFIPIYEERRRRHEPWPGFIENVMSIAPERGAFLPKEMHLLDPEVLTRVFEEAGFKTIEARTMSRTDFPLDLQWDGRESVGYIGEK